MRGDRPLAWAGVGFVLLLLTRPVHGYDALPDWFGWLLVGVGVAKLPRAFPLRGFVLGLGSLAFAVAAILWVPSVYDALDDADDALAWVANLPTFGTIALFCFALSLAADRDGESRPGYWWRTLSIVALMVAALPVLIFGGGLALTGLAGLLVGLLLIAVPTSAFLHAGRSWADPETTNDRHPESG